MAITRPAVTALLLAATFSGLASPGHASTGRTASTAIRKAGSGSGLGGGLDLVAERAFLRTGPNSGSEVRIPTTGQQVVAHLEWRIDGVGAPVQVSIRALLDGAVVCSTNSQVEPGALVTTFCNGSQTVPEGGHVLRWEIDYTAAIEESNEGNNAIRHIWRTGGTLDLAARVAFIRSGPGSGEELPTPNPGETVFFHVAWTIVGFPSGADVSLRASIDGSSFCSGVINPGGTSLTTWCAAGWQVTQAPSHILEWELDPHDEIAESNESNNLANHLWLIDSASTPTPTVALSPTRTRTVPAPTGTPSSTATSRTATQTPVATRTPTGGAASTIRGGFARGDADCSLENSANDLVLAQRGVAVEGCDNADCDRDGNLDQDDVDCTVGCLFEQCPVPPHAPRISRVEPESTSTISSYSVIRVFGEGIDADSPRTSLLIGDRLATIVGSGEQGELLAVVPAVAGNVVDLRVRTGDLDGPAFSVSLADPQRVGDPDTFEGFLDLTLEVVQALLDFDGFDAAFGDRATFARGALQAFADDQESTVDTLLAAPAFDMGLDDSLSFQVDASGLPERARDIVAMLGGAAADGHGAGSPDAVVDRAGALLATAGHALESYLRNALESRRNQLAEAADQLRLIEDLIRTLGNTRIVLGDWVVLRGPLLVRNAAPQPVEPGDLWTLEGNISDSFPTLFSDLSLQLHMVQSGAQIELEPEASTATSASFRIPDEVGVCGIGVATLSVLDQSIELPFQVRPVLEGLGQSSAVPNERVRVLFRGLAGCLSGPLRPRVTFEQLEGDRSEFASTELGSTDRAVDGANVIVPRVVPGDYRSRLDLAGAVSVNSEEISMGTSLTDLEIVCQDTIPRIGSTAFCFADQKPSFRDAPQLGRFEYLWSTAPDDIVSIHFLGDQTDRPLVTAQDFGRTFLSVELRRTDVDRLIVAGSEAFLITVPDGNAPTVMLTRDSPEIIEDGDVIQVTVLAEDDTAMGRIRLTAEGSAVLEGQRQQDFNCPTNVPGFPEIKSRRCSQTFTVDVDDQFQDRRPVVVTAVARDIFGNDSAPGSLTFRFSGGEVQGTIRNSQTGGAVAAQTVQLFDDTGGLVGQDLSGDATFLFPAIPPGTYTLRVVARGFLPATFLVDVADNETTSADISLDPLGPDELFFRKIADTGTTIPRLGGTFVNLFAHAIENGLVVFNGTNLNGGGIYGNRGLGVFPLVDTTLDPPNTGGSSDSFSPIFGHLSLAGNLVVFTNGSTGRRSPSDLVWIKDTRARSIGQGFSFVEVAGYPEGSAPEDLSHLIGFRSVAFTSGHGGFGAELSPQAGTQFGIYAAASNRAVVIADESTSIPGGGGTFRGFAFEVPDNGVSFSAFEGRGSVAFIGLGVEPQQGVYFARELATTFGYSAPELVADTSMIAPDGDEAFTRFCGVSIDGRDVAFNGRAGTSSGIYARLNGNLVVIADRQTPFPPDGAAGFNLFDCATSIDDQMILFEARRLGPATRHGIFVFRVDEIVKVVEDGDILDGKTVVSVSLQNQDSLDAGEVVFQARFEDGTSGVFAALVP